MEWSPPEEALHLVRFGSGNDNRRLVIVAQHADWPYTFKADPASTSLEDELQKAAFDYLNDLKTRFDDRYPPNPGEVSGFLSDDWLRALDPLGSFPGKRFFGWYPLVKAGDPVKPIASRVIEIQKGKASRAYVLVAGENFNIDDPDEPVTSGFGVRVFMHALGDQIKITSMVAHLPHFPYTTVVNGFVKAVQALNERETADFATEIQGRLRESFLPIMQAQVSLAAGQNNETVRVAQFRLLESDVSLSSDRPLTSDWVTYGVEKTPLDEVYASQWAKPFFGALTRFSFMPDRSSSAQLQSRWPLFSDAGNMVKVMTFDQDPVSDPGIQDPPPYMFIPRPATDLDDIDRTEVWIPRKLETPNFAVLNCPKSVEADEGKDPSQTHELTLADGQDINPRSDVQSAISSFASFEYFFALLESLEINLGSLMRTTQAPIHVRYRSGIPGGPGKDGRTVNARVELGPLAAPTPPKLGRTIVHLALANLNHWHRETPTTGSFRPPRAQPLGIANSRRWILHELGHVVILGALGELEFRFAHSIGDAFAAIMSDPLSRISEAKSTGPWNDFRYQTFPWVFSTRRHDRSVLNGWSWSGYMHQDVLSAPEAQLRNLKGYTSEQILSTTLFRLYRILGGDTHRANDPDEPDPDTRRRTAAANLCLYLMVRAIDSFGHAPLRAEELETAMIDADTALPTGFDLGGGLTWTGGQARKAIRWAFEAQGMHPENPDMINNGPGAPPPVDLYVLDHRKESEFTTAGEVHYGKGNYLPVSLHTGMDAEWLAKPNDDDLPVIGNRGSLEVSGYKLRHWFGIDIGDDISWIFGPIEQDVTQPLQEQETRSTAMPDLDGEGLSSAIWWFVEVSASEDRANTDPLALLSSRIEANGTPPTSKRELADLVATDNNLGLFPVDLS